jgi:hypothetical protein
MLIGLSKAGSWPIQTPFWTSAQIVQPTAQKGQIVFLRAMLGSIDGVIAADRCT